MNDSELLDKDISGRGDNAIIHGIPNKRRSLCYAKVKLTNNVLINYTNDHESHRSTTDSKASILWWLSTGDVLMTFDLPWPRWMGSHDAD